MSDSENSFLRRFLPQPRPKPEPASVAVTRARQQEAGVAADLFAREAVAALRLLEQSFGDSDPGAASELGLRFAELWDRAGLADLDWTDPERGDAERILAAAAELANDPAGQLTLDEAWVRAGQNGEPVVDRPSDIQADIRSAYGATSLSLSQDPMRWMQQSLRRMQRARVVQDLVGAGTTVQLPQDTLRLVDELTSQTRRLADTRRAVDRAASAFDKASDRYTKSMQSTVGFWTGSAVGAMISDAPIPIRAALMTPGVILALRAYDRKADLDVAQSTYTSEVMLHSDAREAVAGVVDQMPASLPGSARPGQRPGMLDRFRREGGGAGR